MPVGGHNQDFRSEVLSMQARGSDRLRALSPVAVRPSVRTLPLALPHSATASALLAPGAITRVRVNAILRVVPVPVLDLVALFPPSSLTHRRAAHLRHGPSPSLQQTQQRSATMAPSRSPLASLASPTRNARAAPLMSPSRQAAARASPTCNG